MFTALNRKKWGFAQSGLQGGRSLCHVCASVLAPAGQDGDLFKNTSSTPLFSPSQLLLLLSPV